MKLRSKALALGVGLLLALTLISSFTPQAKAQVVNSTNSNAAVSPATTVTCTLYGVIKYDVIYVLASSIQTESAIADSPTGNSYTQITQENLATATVASESYLFDTTAGASVGTLTITVTWAHAAESVVFCMDTAGFSATAHLTSTGAGTYSATQSFGPSVISYSPTAGNLEVSMMGGSSCGKPAAIVAPATPTGSTKLGSGLDTGSSCTIATDFQYVGATAYYLSASGAAQTDPYTVTGPSAVTVNTANWTEVAADFTANTVNSTALAETNTLAVHDQTPQQKNTESDVAKIIAQVAQRVNAQIVGFRNFAGLPNAVNLEQDCLGVQITINSSPTLNTGVLCGAPAPSVVTVVVACNFFEFQCWWFPMIFMGIYFGMAVGIGAAFEVSDKDFMYLILSLTTFGSLVCVNLGIMTPMLPILLLAGNIIYSTDLGGIAYSALKRQPAGGTTQ
jgi:hypothetical protein